MTRLRGELTTYRARGGHATDWANPTRLETYTNGQMQNMQTGSHRPNLKWKLFIVFLILFLIRSRRQRLTVCHPDECRLQHEMARRSCGRVWEGPRGTGCDRQNGQSADRKARSAPRGDEDNRLRSHTSARAFRGRQETSRSTQAGEYWKKSKINH